ERAGERAAELIATLHRGLQRHIGVDIKWDYRALDAEEGHGNAKGIIDLRGTRKGGIEAFVLKSPKQCEGQIARDSIVEIAPGEMPTHFTSDMQGEGGCAMQEKLVGVIVSADYPNIGRKLRQSSAILSSEARNAVDCRFILSIGKGEELGSVRHDDATEHACCRVSVTHGCSSQLLAGAQHPA